MNNLTKALKLTPEQAQELKRIWRKPSVTEIAQIAATLARDFEKHNALDYLNLCAERAVYLWHSSQWALAKDEQERDGQNEGAQLRREAGEGDNTKWKYVPKRFPVRLEKFLKFALPKRRSPDRMKIYRDTMRKSIGLRRRFTASDLENEVGAAMAEIRKAGLNEQQFYSAVAALREYEARLKKENFSKRAKAGGLKSAQMRKRKSKSKSG